MEKLHFKELISYLNCNGSEYTSFISSFYIRGHVLSFAISNDFECGGAHLDFATMGRTFNMETGHEMELTDFLFFGKTKVYYPTEKSYKIRSEITAANIVNILTELYPDEMGNSEEDQICNYSDLFVWGGSWYLNEQGLYIYLIFQGLQNAVMELIYLLYHTRF